MTVMKHGLFTGRHAQSNVKKTSRDQKKYEKKCFIYVNINIKVKLANKS